MGLLGLYGFYECSVYSELVYRYINGKNIVRIPNVFSFAELPPVGRYLIAYIAIFQR